jgi:hypothetical protein
VAEPAGACVWDISTESLFVECSAPAAATSELVPAVAVESTGKIVGTIVSVVVVVVGSMAGELTREVSVSTGERWTVTAVWVSDETTEISVTAGRVASSVAGPVAVAVTG